MTKESNYSQAVEKRFQENIKVKKPSESFKRAGKTMWDIIEELKGTAKRKSFYEWLSKG